MVSGQFALGRPGPTADMDRRERFLHLSSMEDHSALSLGSLLEKLADRPIGGFGRAWVGATPSDEPSMIAAIASKIGLDARGRESDFQTISAEDAAVWLTLFATQSLLHGERAIPRGVHEDVAAGLATLGSDAKFFSKGLWQQTRRFKYYEPVRLDSGWTRARHRLFYQSGSEPLPPIDVLDDGGILGFGAHIAFAFWVEEDD